MAIGDWGLGIGAIQLSADLPHRAEPSRIRSAKATRGFEISGLKDQIQQVVLKVATLLMSIG